MKSLLMGVLLAAALTSQAQIHGDDWEYRYYFTGSFTSMVDGIGSTEYYNHREVSGAGRGGMFKGPPPGVTASSNLKGTFEIQAKWLGQGQPPPKLFLKVHCTATGNWSGSSGGDSASNGLNTRAVHHPTNYGDLVVCDGYSSFPVVLDNNGTMKKNISIASHGEAYAVLGSTGATSQISATIVPRRVIVDAPPGPTYYRGPGGIFLTGGWQEDTGKCRIDRAYKVTNFFGEIKGRFFEKMLGQADGDWDLPITAFDWEGLNYKWVNKFWNIGLTEAWNWEEYVDKPHLIQGFNGPDIRHSTSKITDNRGQEEGEIVFYTHSPVEGTDEKWKADLTGPTRLARVPEARAAGFTDEVIGSISNYSHEIIDANVTISSSASYTYGAQEEYGGNVGLEWEIVKLNFSTQVTKSSSETYTVGKSYSIGVRLPPMSTLRLIAVPMGGVKFPICSKWNDSGYCGSNNNLDVQAGFIDYAVFIKAVDPWQ